MQIFCDTHAHTIASTHAYSTVHDYLAQAKQLGLQLFGLTEHGPNMPDSPHYWHFINRKVIPRVVDNIIILRGIEANILPSEYMQFPKRFVDIHDGLLEHLDYAIASFHEPVFKPGSIAENTKAMIRAIESGVVQIIGHPGNPAYPIEQSEVIRAAKDHNVALEINNSSFTTSRTGSEVHCCRLLELIDQLDWKVSVGSDAHIAFALGDFTSVQQQMQKLRFPQERIVSRNPQTFLDFLAEHGKDLRPELKALSVDWAMDSPADSGD